MTATMLKTFVLKDDINARALWAFLKANWRALAASGRPVAVTVQQHKVKRSVDQNKRYWAILNDIAENAWAGGRRYSADAWHEHFKRRFIGSEETPDGGLVGISTTTLDVARASALAHHKSICRNPLKNIVHSQCLMPSSCKLLGNRVYSRLLGGCHEREEGKEFDGLPDGNRRPEKAEQWEAA